MTNEEIIMMLGCIKRHEFCESAMNHPCEDIGCTECMVDFCKKQLEEGKELKIWEENHEETNRTIRRHVTDCYIKGI